MFIAHFENTMRGARPKPDINKPDHGRIVDTLAARRASIRRELKKQADELARVRAAVAIEREKANADIALANAALRKLHEQWAIADRKIKLQGQSRIVVAPVTIDTIVRRICRALHLSRADVLSDRRSVDIAFARQAICYWASRRTGKSTPQIGRALGRDHTSVLHGKAAYVEKRAAMGRKLRRV